MNINAKVTLLFVAMMACLLAVLVAISLYAFRSFSIASATEHIRTASEIVRVNLTEAMINGTIDKREHFLQRLVEVQGLRTAQVIRSQEIERQFGKGLNVEKASNDLERAVLGDGKARFEVITVNDETLLQGVIPYIATTSDQPNCLQCHVVPEGAVLGAVSMSMSIEALKSKALLTVAGIAGAVTLFALLLTLLLRQLLHPISKTARALEEAVQRALQGDFKAHIEQRTDDEIGQIASDTNRLLNYIDAGLNHIGANVARLTEHQGSPGGNLLTATTEMVDGLTRASQFKQAIEEDESKAEIYQRLSTALQQEFGIKEFSLYEVSHGEKRIQPMVIDGVAEATCRWCDPQITVRPEGCRVRRTGHQVDGIENPLICQAFSPPEEAGERRYLCLPILQSGTVGSVVQLLCPPEQQQALLEQAPLIQVYLREAAPVLEARRLMESLRESTLRDPMTGLNNRRFLEEYIDTLVAGIQRKRTTASILMLDLDYFKMVNDTYGHDAGDTVLKTLAKVLRQSVRASDLVIRYGGEEFLIILLETGGENSDKVAEKIRMAVESLKIPLTGASLQKTISIGIADFPTDSDIFWQALKYADVALYQAKEQGRNRVIRFKPEMWQVKEY